jgi:UDP-N-acetylmuramoylalanine--D-glutamate ligase
MGVPALSCGNIGNPFIGEVERINKEKITPVIEVSSFQLMHISRFRPHVGLILNMEPDHLDWHKDTEEYYDGKFRMFMNQTDEDTAVLNDSDKESLKRAGRLRSKIRWFRGGGGHTSDPNWNAVLEAAQEYGLERQKALKILEGFQGIEHRLERVASEDGRLYINDSKSTNLSSLVWALNRMSRPVVLIMGGRSKGADFTQITGLLRDKTRHIVLIGESQGEISRGLCEGISHSLCGSLKEAVEEAQKKSSRDGVILFSPACASFDMFQDYQDRGRRFKRIVNELDRPCRKTASVS